jgi:hypothetical protein
MSIKIKNNENISYTLPLSSLANCILSFAFQLDAKYVTSNIYGLLTVKTQKNGGRITSLKTINLATANDFTIPGVSNILYFTLTNAIGFDTLVINIDQLANVVLNVGNGGNSSSDGTYRGTYNADTNTPFLQNGVGQPGDFYICTVAGINNPTQALLQVNEIIMYNGSVWQNLGSINGTDDIAVSDGYIVIMGQKVTVGQSVTFALGVLQGQIDAITNTFIPIQISTNVDRNIYPTDMILNTPYTFINTGNQIINLKFFGGLTLINPTALNGNSTTAGLNPTDVYTFTKLDNNQIIIT